MKDTLRRILCSIVYIALLVASIGLGLLALMYILAIALLGACQEQFGWIAACLPCVAAVCILVVPTILTILWLRVAIPPIQTTNLDQSSDVSFNVEQARHEQSWPT